MSAVGTKTRIVTSCGCCSHCHDVTAEPLVLSNGKDLLTMVCRGANTTVNVATEDEDSHDFCAPTFQHFCGSLSVLRMLCGSDVPKYTTTVTAVAPYTSIGLAPSGDRGSTSLLSCAACFRVLALRRGATLVTAATLRIFGANFAELPFVATKEGELSLTVWDP